MQENIPQEQETEISTEPDNLTSDSLQPQSTSESSTQELKEEDELTRLNNELLAQKDKYIRLFAEFDNFKRRSARESIELRQTAGKEIMLSLLDVVDDCDRAEKQMKSSEDVKQIKEGVQLVFNKLRNTLQNRGLKSLESLHSDFDIEKHEAIAEVPVTDKKMIGKVVDEIDKGYYLNEKLIRFAKVVVGKEA